MRFLTILTIFFLFTVQNPTLLASSNNYSIDPEDRSGNWSIGFNYDVIQSPYIGEQNRTDVMPNFIYMGESFYLDTTELGWHIIDDEQWQLDIGTHYLLAGYNDHTFFSNTGDTRPEDDPLKGMERSGTFEGKIALTYKTDFGRWVIGINHDLRNTHGGGGVNSGWNYTWDIEHWQLRPWVEINWLSSEKSNYYFGVNEDEALDNRPPYYVSDSMNLGVGIAMVYNPWPEHFIAFNLGYTYFESNISDSPIIEENAIFTTSISYRYQFSELGSSQHDNFNFFSNNPNPWSMRLAYGCTSDTSLNEILRFNIDCEGDGTNLASLFLSRQISETFFTLPIEAWITSGIARRFESDYHDNFWEGVFAFKAIFRKFPWSDSVETRFGVAEGLSYAQTVPNIETERAEERDRRTSHLLNYLDFSLDVSVGDVLQNKDWRHCFAGWSIHHRSGIFASSNLYGNVYGGSNVNTLYLECEY